MLEMMIKVRAIALIVQTVVKRVSFFNNYTYIEGERIPKISDNLLTLYQATVVNKGYKIGVQEVGHRTGITLL